MYCSKCGAQVMEGTSFCMQCGTSLQNNPPVQTKPDSEAKENMKQENFTQSTQAAENTAVPTQEIYRAQGAQNTGKESGQYYPPQPQPQPMPYGMGNQAFNNNYHIPIKNYDPSKDYTPIGMWGYFGYQILFAIPILGFILILIFSFGGTRNINLRNYARSTFCIFIILGVIVLLIALIAALFSASLAG